MLASIMFQVYHKLSRISTPGLQVRIFCQFWFNNSTQFVWITGNRIEFWQPFELVSPLRAWSWSIIFLINVTPEHDRPCLSVVNIYVYTMCGWIDHQFIFRGDVFALANHFSGEITLGRIKVTVHSKTLTGAVAWSLGGSSAPACVLVIIWKMSFMHPMY